MGNLLTVIVNAVMEEVAKKVRSLGYHAYNIDFENNFTIDGIRNNPKCKFQLKKTSVSAEDLFVLENVSMDRNSRLSVCIRIPKVMMNIGRAGFNCNDPKFSCAVKGWVQLSDIYLTLNVSVEMNNTGLQIDHISVKPKISEIKSEIQLLVNKKECSEMANALLNSKDPAPVNFLLEFFLTSQEDDIKQFLNNQMKEAQRSPSFD